MAELSKLQPDIEVEVYPYAIGKDLDVDEKTSKPLRVMAVEAFRNEITGVSAVIWAVEKRKEPDVGEI